MQGSNYSKLMVFSRNELVMTLMEFSAIALAARIGLGNFFRKIASGYLRGHLPLIERRESPKQILVNNPHLA
jgi:hypothetical protein